MLLYENQKRDEFSQSLHLLRTEEQTVSSLGGCSARVELMESSINVIIPILEHHRNRRLKFVLKFGGKPLQGGTYQCDQGLY